jgi:Glyoxalase-like domain
MAPFVSHFTFDARDAFAQAVWWAEVLGGEVGPDDVAGDAEAEVRLPATPLLFITVPEGKVVKNRAHLDVQPQELTRDAEVERVMALGATFVDDQRHPDGRGWVVLADPEGNEFCIVRSAAERSAP